MAGVNAYKDGVVAGLYKGLQGLVKAAQDHLRRGRRQAGRARTRSRSTASATPAATSCWPPARTRKTLPGLEIDGERVITSEHALTLDRVPASAIVLGGGVIGVEFASVWRSLRRRRDHRRGAAPAGRRRGRGRLQGARAGVPQARHQLQGRQAVREGRADRDRRQGDHRRRRDHRGRAAAGRRRPRPDHRQLGYEEQGVTWTAASCSPTSGCAPTCRTSTPSATSCPACSSRTAASSRASSSPRRSPG